MLSYVIICYLHYNYRRYLLLSLFFTYIFMVHISLSPYNTRPLGLMVHIICVIIRYTICYHMIVYGPYADVSLFVIPIDSVLRRHKGQKPLILLDKRGQRGGLLPSISPHISPHIPTILHRKKFFVNSA